MKILNPYKIEAEGVVSKLSSNAEKGLTETEAKNRREKYGPNELPRGKRLTWLKLFLNQFANPLIIILLVAAGLTFYIEERLDTVIILLAVFVNTAMGFYQEFHSNKTLEKLKELIKVSARVLRDGSEKEVSATELVVGDIILLHEGVKVPADARIISDRNLEINEALLTGESSPINKNHETIKKETPLADRDNMIHMGTIVEKGEAKAIVTFTAIDTEIGKIAKLTKEVKETKTPLQERLDNIARTLTYVFALAAVVILVTGVFEKIPLVEMVTIAVAVAVASIPEGMPAAISVTLSVATKKISETGGLTKKLVAAEALGTTTVICADKTGTLTEGEMKVEKIVPSLNDTALTILALSNEAIVEEGIQPELLTDEKVKLSPKEKALEFKIRGEATDRAKMEYAFDNGKRLNELLNKFPRRAFLSFDPEKKYIASFHEINSNTYRIFISGAPEILIQKSAIGESELREFNNEYEKLSSSGYRVIGLATRDINNHPGFEKLKDEELHNFIKDLKFEGFVTIRDPIRKDVKKTIEEAREAGIKIRMITGDHKLTAMSVGRDLGFMSTNESIIDGIQLDNTTDEQLETSIGRYDIFARVTPAHKIRIIKAYQKRGEVVAMTGDGINDAPAVKMADIGIAIGTGSEVTKEAADLVLLNNSFSSIEAAIKQGRVTFDNIRKLVVKQLSNSFTALLLIMSSLIFRVPLAVTAIQILWTNLVEDGLPSVALAFEPAEKDVMKRKPVKRGMPIMDKMAKIIIFVMAIISDFILVGLFLYLFFSTNMDLERIRTIIFMTLGIDSLLFTFSIKSLNTSIFKTNLLNNHYLLFSIAVGLILMFGAVYLPVFNKFLKTVPLNINEVLLVFVLVFIQIALIEIVKWRFRVSALKS